MAEMRIEKRSKRTHAVFPSWEFVDVDVVRGSKNSTDADDE